MTRIASLGFLVLVLLATICATQPDDVPGNIRLLPGYVHPRGQGIDCAVGRIARRGGLVIEYDLGRLAGAYISWSLFERAAILWDVEFIPHNVSH